MSYFSSILFTLLYYLKIRLNLPLYFALFYPYFSMFFNDSLVGEGRGSDILPGTPLRMPQMAEYDSFVKIIMQVCLCVYVCYMYMLCYYLGILT